MVRLLKPQLQLLSKICFRGLPASYPAPAFGQVQQGDKPTESASSDQVTFHPPSLSDIPEQFTKQLEQVRQQLSHKNDKFTLDVNLSDMGRKLIGQAVQLFRATQIPLPNLFIADFTHELQGVVSATQQTLFLDGFNELAFEKNGKLPKPGSLAKAQPVDGPPEFLSLDECKQRIDETWNAVAKTFQRYHFYIQEGLNEPATPQNVLKAWQMAKTASQEKAQAKGLRLEIIHEDLLTEAAKRIQYPPHKIYALLSNLIFNAIKYTPNETQLKGKGVVSVEFNPTEQGFQVTVTDNGIGIPTNEQAQVLQGKRASNALSHRIPGTGYGLKRVAKMCQSITIQSPVPQVNHPHSGNPERPGTQVQAQLYWDQPDEQF